LGLKIFITFIFVYMAAIGYLTVSKEKFIKKSAEKREKIPLIEFKNIKNYHITKSGVDTIVKAKEALRFKDHDEIKEVDILTFYREQKEILKAKQANLKQNKIFLYGDIFYQNEEGITLKSQKMEYDIKNKIISSKTPFTLNSKKALITGESFVYNRQKGIIKATKIEATIKETEKI